MRLAPHPSARVRGRQWPGESPPGNRDPSDRRAPDGGVRPDTSPNRGRGGVLPFPKGLHPHRGFGRSAGRKPPPPACVFSGRRFRPNSREEPLPSLGRGSLRSCSTPFGSANTPTTNTQSSGRVRPLRRDIDGTSHTPRTSAVSQYKPGARGISASGTTRSNAPSGTAP